MPPRIRRVLRMSEENIELGHLTVSDGIRLMNEPFDTPQVVWGEPLRNRGVPIQNATINPDRAMGGDDWDEADPFDSPERPQDSIDLRTIQEMERMFLETSRLRGARFNGAGLPPLTDSAPQVNIKRHLSKSERDSRHKPAKDVKKIVAISLDDLVSI